MYLFIDLFIYMIYLFIDLFIYLYVFIYWFIYLFYLGHNLYIYIYTCFCEMLRADPSKKCQAKDAEPGAAWEPVVGWWSLVVCGVYQ